MLKCTYNTRIPLHKLIYMQKEIGKGTAEIETFFFIKTQRDTPHNGKWLFVSCEFSLVIFIVVCNKLLSVM